MLLIKGKQLFMFQDNCCYLLEIHVFLFENVPQWLAQAPPGFRFRSNHSNFLTHTNPCMVYLKFTIKVNQR